MRARVCWVIFALIFGLIVNVSFAQEPNTPIWQSADTIRIHLLDAQRELFAANRSDNPAIEYANASQLITEATDIYTSQLQPQIQQYASDTDKEIVSAFMDASQTAQTGDGVGLALQRGNIQTWLLNASYQITLEAIASGDVDIANNWLAFREYRQATRVTIVLNPSANAMKSLSQGDITVEEVIPIVENDLGDAYYFRLRQALAELESALDTDYPIRSAEWLGQMQGYFSIFAADYTEQIGKTIAPDILDEIEALIVAGDLDTARDMTTAFRDAIADYQPITFSDSQIAERGQLLYIFTDLVYIEYKDGVRNGEITIPIEYQEANTFLAQARSTFEELRPTMLDSNAEETEELEILFDELQATLDELGSVDVVRERVELGKTIISNNLPLDLENGTAATFTIVNALLDDVEASIADKRYRDAENTRLQAYALFDFGPEQRLLAFQPDLAVTIDGLFWHGTDNHSGLARVIATQGSANDARAVRQELNNALEEAQIILGTASQPLTTIVNSAIIVFREGLEAVVIIAALSAGMIKINTAYRRPLFAGAIGAFLATGFTWLVADAFLSLFRDYGERLEAVVSLIALGVLLIITNWFFHKVYWTDHLAGFHQRKGQILKGEAGKYLGLMILGFTSIYREGFETVLFLQALVLDAGILTVLQGVLLGLLGVGVVGYITFKMQTRLPYMKMMVVTGILIGVVLIMLVGNTVRVMQVVAWLPVHPIEGVNFPYWWGQWFGVYPTWEGILAQVGAATFVIGSYYLAEYQSRKQRLDRQQHTNKSTDTAVNTDSA